MTKHESHKRHRLVPVSCGVCSADKPRALCTIRGLNIVICSQCGCIYTNPRSIWNYRAHVENIEESVQAYCKHYLPARQARYNRVWRMLASYHQLGSLLDVGCGYGFFLSAAQKQGGWQVKGVEPQPDQADWARQSLNLSVVDDLYSEVLEPGSFDVITVWDVIEHVPDMWPFLRRCRELLRPGGLFLARTPNAEGLLLIDPWWLRPFLFLYRHLVYPANPLEHCYHFTPAVLTHVLEKTGFRVVGNDTRHTSEEWTIGGRNILVYLVRKVALMPLAWRLHLPYEFTLLAENR